MKTTAQLENDSPVFVKVAIPLAYWIVQCVLSLFLSWWKSWLWIMVHQSKEKPFAPQLAQNLLLQLFCEKKNHPQPEYTSEPKKRHEFVPWEHSLSSPEVTYLISQTITSENPDFLFGGGGEKEGKILFSSCQLWTHGDAPSTYAMSFILTADVDIKAQRIGVTLPGSLASKFSGSDRPAQSIWGQNWQGT